MFAAARAPSRRRDFETKRRARRHQEDPTPGESRSADVDGAAARTRAGGGPGDADRSVLTTNRGRRRLRPLYASIDELVRRGLRRSAAAQHWPSAECVNARALVVLLACLLEMPTSLDEVIGSCSRARLHWQRQAPLRSIPNSSPFEINAKQGDDCHGIHALPTIGDLDKRRRPTQVPGTDETEKHMPRFLS